MQLVSWPETSEAICAVRKAVFIREQQVPPELEWDGKDPECVHVLVRNEAGEPIGTGRLEPSGRIGRMAVLKAFRRRGVGRTLVLALILAARRRGLQRISLAAQTQAVGFYEKYGFRLEGEEFMDAGIPHCLMTMRLAERRPERTPRNPLKRPSKA
ncbi:MAG: GNAT family N-acetyltransferase [Nitrospirales bacterium]